MAIERDQVTLLRERHPTYILPAGCGPRCAEQERWAEITTRQRLAATGRTIWNGILQREHSLVYKFAICIKNTVVEIMEIFPVRENRNQ